MDACGHKFVGSALRLTQPTGYRLENDPRSLRRIERARKSLGAGEDVRLEDIDAEE